MAADGVGHEFRAAVLVVEAGEVGGERLGAHCGSVAVVARRVAELPDGDAGGLGVGHDGVEDVTDVFGLELFGPLGCSGIPVAIDAAGAHFGEYHRLVGIAFAESGDKAVHAFADALAELLCGAWLGAYPAGVGVEGHDVTVLKCNVLEPVVAGE